MMANGHLEMDMVPDDRSIEHIFFKATPAGVVAFQESYYLKQIEERRNEWPTYFREKVKKLPTNSIVTATLPRIYSAFRPPQGRF